MNLKNKKRLAAETFGVGKNRIIFANSSLKEIGEAITKNDLRELQKEGIIIIKNKKGSKKTAKKKKRSTGNVRKKINKRKKEYVKMTRKLRRHILSLKSKGEISQEDFKKIRKKIRNRQFKSKANLKQHLGENKKWKRKREEDNNIKQIIKQD